MNRSRRRESALAFPLPRDGADSRPRLRVSWVVNGCLAAALWLVAAPAFAAEPPKLPPLTTSGAPRLPGKFIWADLVTDDVPAARKFYGQMFGWFYQQAGDYTLAKNQDRPIAGFVQRPRPQDRAAQPRWIPYMSVDDLPTATHRVKQGGGRVLAPAQKLPRRGEQAVFADTEGAVFGVIKSSSGDPQDFLAEPGDWVWLQLFSRDARKAGEFYRQVGGHEVLENDTAARPGSFVLASKGYARAAMMTIPEKHQQVKPAWLPFVRVTSVADTVSKATRLGGKVLIAPRNDLLEGRVAVLADPTGAAIGIMEWSAELAKGAQ